MKLTENRITLEKTLYNNDVIKCKLHKMVPSYQHYVSLMKKLIGSVLTHYVHVFNSFRICTLFSISFLKS